MNKYKLSLPLKENEIASLKSGDIVLLSGTIYTARDAAHQRMVNDYNKTQSFPFDIKDQAIYYVGPSPTKPNKVVGSAGPTSAYRMDKYTPFLLDKGLKIMIAKGKRNDEVINSIIKNKALYLGIIGGAAALVSKSIIASEVIAYEDLGPEAIHKYEVRDLECFVLIDSYGNNLYKDASAYYRNILNNQ